MKTLNDAARRATAITGALAIGTGALVLNVGLTAQPGGAASTPTGSITVQVFQDFNANGVRNTAGDAANPAIDALVDGVTITAVCLTDNGADGIDGSGDTETYNPAATATDDGAGTYTFAALPGSPCRIEATALPAGFTAGPLGIDSGGLVQFAGVGSTVRIGINRPGDFCQNTPNLIVPCAAFGDAAAGSASDSAAIHSFPASASGSQLFAPLTTTTPVVLATTKQVGSIFGMEFRSSDATVFASAYTKLYSGFGPGGAGAIYAIDPTGVAAPSVFATIPNSGSLPARDAYAPNVGANHGGWLADGQYWDLVGRSSLGDINLTPDESTLWVVNLSDRKLYPVNAVTGAVGAGVATPTPSTTANPCAEAQVRPFGLGSDGTKMLLGLVCAGPLASDLAAYVYSFDPGTGAASAAPIFETALDYTHGRAGDGCGPDPLHGNWNAWTASNVWNGSNAVSYCAYPQPMLSDIDVDSGGALVLSLRDRFGDQSGFNQPAGTFGGGGTGNGAGDVLRACRSAAGWVLEADGSCGGVAGAGVGDNEGPGTGEFYSDSLGIATGGGNGADEIGVGAATIVPGTTNLYHTVRDPHTSNNDAWGAGGVRTASNNTGAVLNFFEVYDKCSSGALSACTGGRVPSYTFGKSNGIGDVVAACDRAPVEIGNRVWLDANKNGQQDAGERPIAGVAVTLKIGTATTVATTDADGVYVFSSDSRPAGQRPALSSGRYAVPGLVPGAVVSLSVPTSVSVDGVARSLTTRDVGSNTSDSDAAPATGATSSITVGGAGANDHTWDFGYSGQASPPTIDLAIAKRVTSQGPYKAGSTVTFELAVTNNGPATAKVGFSVHDRLPTGLTFSGVTTPASGAGYACAAPIGQVVVCTSDHTLAPVVGGTPKDLLTITAKVMTPAPAAGTVLKNVTWVLPSEDELVETIPMSPTEPTDATNTTTTPTNNDAEAKITLNVPPGRYDLALIKTATPVPCDTDGKPRPCQYGVKGKNIVFVVTVANQGTVNSGTFTVLDTMPSFTSFASATGSPTRTGRTLTWTISNLAPGARRSFTITLKVVEEAAVFRNWAEISSDSGEDEDSTPDTDTGVDQVAPNDEVVNHNDITKDTVPGDEDDNDYEAVFGKGPDVA